METKKCPNCGNDIPAETTVCPLCGKSFAESIGSAQNNGSKLSFEGNMKLSLIAAALAVIGIIVMIAYRAWLGLPIYIIGFLIAGKSVKDGHEAFGGTIVEYLKDSIKSKDLSTKINAIVVVIAPIVFFAGIYGIIFKDSQREVDALFDYYVY